MADIPQDPNNSTSSSSEPLPPQPQTHLSVDPSLFDDLNFNSLYNVDNPPSDLQLIPNPEPPMPPTMAPPRPPQQQPQWPACSQPLPSFQANEGPSPSQHLVGNQLLPQPQLLLPLPPLLQDSQQRVMEIYQWLLQYYGLEFTARSYLHSQTQFRAPAAQSYPCTNLGAGLPSAQMQGSFGMSQQQHSQSQFGTPAAQSYPQHNLGAGFPSEPMQGSFGMSQQQDFRPPLGAPDAQLYPHTNLEAGFPSVQGSFGMSEQPQFRAPAAQSYPRSDIREGFPSVQNQGSFGMSNQHFQPQFQAPAAQSYPRTDIRAGFPTVLMQESFGMSNQHFQPQFRAPAAQSYPHTDIRAGFPTVPMQESFGMSNQHFQPQFQAPAAQSYPHTDIRAGFPSVQGSFRMSHEHFQLPRPSAPVGDNNWRNDGGQQRRQNKGKARINDSGDGNQNKHKKPRKESSTGEIVFAGKGKLVDDGYAWFKTSSVKRKGSDEFEIVRYKCANDHCENRKEVKSVGPDHKSFIIFYTGFHNHEKPAATSSSHSKANSDKSGNA